MYYQQHTEEGYFLQCLGEKNGSIFYSSTPLVFLHGENEQYDSN